MCQNEAAAASASRITPVKIRVSYFNLIKKDRDFRANTCDYKVDVAYYKALDYCQFISVGSFFESVCGWVGLNVSEQRLEGKGPLPLWKFSFKVP